MRLRERITPAVSTALTADLIRERLRRGDRADDARLAIVVEGGGMRGVISAAAAGVLEETGIASVADILVGTSAGATNAAAIAAGRAQEFAGAYANVFTDSRFVDPRRAMRLQPPIRTDEIVREVEDRFRIASLAVANTSVELGVVATHVDSAQARTLTAFSTSDYLLTALRASSQLPLIAGGPVRVGGSRWLDGGLTEGVPIRSAELLGATHAIVLRTRPVGLSPILGPADRPILWYLNRLNPELAAAYRARPQAYADVAAQTAGSRFGSMDVLEIAPLGDDPLPSRTERQTEFLAAAATRAAENTLCILRMNSLTS
jgi:predicted patatin/cPLA2 family phospholipase